MGATIKEGRQAMGKSVSMFAKDLGCSTNTLRKIEAGKADAETYFKIISSWPAKEQLIAFEAIFKGHNFYNDPEYAKFCDEFLGDLRAKVENNLII
jgi:DNA-binding XRE family transcriptional regulator